MKGLGRHFLLEPGTAYLNHGSFGACPAPVFADYQNWQRALEANPLDFFMRRAPDLMNATRSTLARYLGAKDDEIIYATNVTVALNIVARSLELGPGDEVVTTNHEYGACDRIWRFICRRRGATLTTVRLPDPLVRAQEVVDTLAAALSPATKVLFFSHITSPTGVVLPAAEICAAARRAGVITVVDGAHAPGQIPLDLTGLGADFYGGNCHKWLCAPKGAGFLYARRDVQDLLDPLVISWGWESAFPGPSRYVDEQEMWGTRDLAAFLSVPAAIQFQADHGWDDVRAACHALARVTRRRLLEIPGTAPIHSEDPAWYRQMVSVSVPEADPMELMNRLYREHKVEAVAFAWNDRTLVRASIQGYNEPEDVDRLIQALPQVL